MLHRKATSWKWLLVSSPDTMVTTWNHTIESSKNTCPYPEWTHMSPEHFLRWPRTPMLSVIFCKTSISLRHRPYQLPPWLYPVSFHLGYDFVRDDNGTMCMSPRKYIENPFRYLWVYLWFQAKVECHLFSGKGRSSWTEYVWRAGCQWHQELPVAYWCSPVISASWENRYHHAVIDHVWIQSCSKKKDI